MFRCLPDSHPQYIVPTKYFALRRVHLRAYTYASLFFPSKTTCFGMRATPATHSGIAALRPLKIEKNLIAHQFGKS